MYCSLIAKLLFTALMLDFFVGKLLLIIINNKSKINCRNLVKGAMQGPIETIWVKQVGIGTLKLLIVEILEY